MRLHITMPEDTVRAIDEVAGKRGRSAFIREAVVKEAERRRKAKLFWSAIYDYPPTSSPITAESISRDRSAETAERDRRIREQWDAP